MATDKACVQRAIPLISNPKLDDYTIQSDFFTLNGDLYLLGQMNEDAHPQLRGHVRLAAQDFLNVVACAHKVEWESDQLIRKQTGITMWSSFAGLDVDATILFLRALLDDLAGAINQSCDRSRTFSSFNKLRTFAKNQPEVSTAYLGHALHDLVVQCGWFGELKGFRDGIIHQGAQSYVNLDGPRVTFQILQRHKPLIQQPALMPNDVTVYFDRFAALYFARTICLLDDVAAAIRAKLQIERLQEVAPSYTHGGLGYLLAWMKELEPHL